MRWLNRRLLRRISVIALALFLEGGCDDVSKALRQRGEDKFELKQDSQGRVIRLNKVTGEVAIVNGTHLIPVTGAEPPATGVAQKRIQTTSKAVAAATRTPASATPAQPGPSHVAAETAVPASGLLAGPAAPGQTVTITLAAPVFVTAKRAATPLQVANKGAVFRLLGVDGEWYQVEFDDARWGPRVGWVEKQYATVSPRNARLVQPIDLSVHDPKIDPLAPVDLSIRDRQ